MGRFRVSKFQQGNDSPWFQIGTLDATTSTILALLCVPSFFIYALKKSWMNALYIARPPLEHFQIWRIISWVFDNYPSLASVFAIAGLWYFGNRIEAMIGRRAMVALVGVEIVVLAAMCLAFNSMLAGVSHISYSLFIGFAAMYPFARSFFQIPLWIIAGVLMAIQVLQLLTERAFPDLAMLLAAVYICVGTLRAFGACEDVPWVPAFGLMRRLGGAKPASRPGATSRSFPTRSKFASNLGGGLKFWRKSNPSSVSGSVGASQQAPKHSTKSGKQSRNEGEVVVGPWPSGSIPQSTVDQLLEKIASKGMNSLSEEERRLLELASKNLRDQRIQKPK